jgi:hypothetical protein
MIIECYLFPLDNGRLLGPLATVPRGGSQWPQVFKNSIRYILSDIFINVDCVFEEPIVFISNEYYAISISIVSKITCCLIFIIFFRNVPHLPGQPFTNNIPKSTRCGWRIRHPVPPQLRWIRESNKAHWENHWKVGDLDDKSRLCIRRKARFTSNRLLFYLLLTVFLLQSGRSSLRQPDHCRAPRPYKPIPAEPLCMLDVPEGNECQDRQSA